MDRRTCSLAVDARGRTIAGDQILGILAEPLLRELPGATIVADVKSGQALFDRIAELGGTPLMWKTGHATLKSTTLRRPLHCMAFFGWTNIETASI